MFVNCWEDEPSSFIQDIAKAYCNERPLYRPNMTYIKVILKWLLIEIAIIGCTLLLIYIMRITTILPESIRNYVNSDMIRAYTLFTLIISLIITLLLLRWLAIDCIQLYQRYAPEKVRRRCILMPSCSEFAVIAFKRYGFIIGCVMTYYRLTKRCRGTIYRIEYPKL